MNLYLMIYLVGVVLSLLLCFVFIRYVDKELRANDLPIVLMCIAGSFVGILVTLITVVSMYVDNNGNKVIWKRKGEYNDR